MVKRRKDWMRAGEAADYLMVSYYTLRSYVKNGLITPEYTPTGQMVFTRSMLDELRTRNNENQDHGRIVFYTRVSSSTASTASQEERLRAAYGEPVRVYKDKASGLNENRRGLSSLLRDARKGLFETVCITARDRLTRFGYSYLEQLLSEYGVSIIVLDDAREPDVHEELMRDFLALLASFSSKYYKLRSLEHDRMLLHEADECLVRKEKKGGEGNEGEATIQEEAHVV